MSVVETARPQSGPDPATIAELKGLQRQRVIYIKTMNMVGTRLQHLVAGTMGYNSGMDETERKPLFAKAAALIHRVVEEGEDHPSGSIMISHSRSIAPLAVMRKPIEKQMEKIAGELPVAEWVRQPDQKGFGLRSLATVVGEAGDLSNYANPGKLWARFGCHPYEKDGESHMGATWKRRARKPLVVKLTSEDWEEFGYSPRRRSIAYIIGENLVKQNGEGPYRKRWIQAKIRAFDTHPEWKWTPCTKCKGEGYVDKVVCCTCGGLGQKCMQAHLHGMLLATKRLLRELWAEWNGRPEKGIWKG